MSLTHPFLQFLLFLQFKDTTNCCTYANKLDSVHHPFLKDMLVAQEMAYDGLEHLGLLHKEGVTKEEVRAFLKSASDA